jgi:hypothetical protein
MNQLRMGLSSYRAQGSQAGSWLMSRDRTWGGLILLLVVALHLWIGWAQAHFHPDRRLARSYRRTPSPTAEVLLVLTFARRAAAAPMAGGPRAKRAARQALDPQDSHSSPSRAPGSVSAVLGQQATPAPLDLSLVSSARPDAYRREILEHPDRLQYRATRFDHAWLSQGTLVEVLARRSVVAATLLGAMGALTKPCTEYQRKHYDVACVPDQYIDSGEEE